MTAPVLRPYQHELIAKLRRSLLVHRHSILQSPTGSGKSVLIAYMIARAAEKGNSCILICHRKELLDQLSATLFEAGVMHGRIAAGSTPTKDRVQVASIQSLVRRIDKLPPFDLTAIDEAHHSTAKTYRKVIEWARSSWIIGLTATPCRTTGEGLDDLFNDLVLGPKVGDLIEMGYLARYVIYKSPLDVDVSGVHKLAGDYVRNELEELVTQSAVVGDAVSHYKRLVAPGTCLVYCVSRAHARLIESAYRAEGIDARYCAGDTPKAERDAIVSGLRRGDPPVVVSVDLFGEGLDAPGLSAVQLLRHTQSLGLYLQQVGRVLRPEPGKDRAIILDHVGNWRRHDLPDTVRNWTLEGSRRRAKSEEAAPALRHCEKCYSIYAAIKGACPLCGWMPEIQAKMPDTQEGELTELTPEEIEKRRITRNRKMEEGRAQGLEALVRLAMARGYRAGWAAHRHHYRTKTPIGQCKADEREIRAELEGFA